MNNAAGTIAENPTTVNFSELDLKRFWSKVQKTDSCWIWIGRKNEDGYGRFDVFSKQISSHRVSHMIHRGQIPEKIYICHKCDNPACVNPEHLFSGTQIDNMKDMISKGRGNKARGQSSGRYTRPEKTARGERCGSAKLTSEKVLQIRALYVFKKTKERDLAKQFGVSKSLIGPIVNRKIWSHI